MSKLTATVVRNADAEAKSYKLADGGGLYLFVKPGTDAPTLSLDSLSTLFRFGRAVDKQSLECVHGQECSGSKCKISRF